MGLLLHDSLYEETTENAIGMYGNASKAVQVLVMCTVITYTVYSIIIVSRGNLKA